MQRLFRLGARINGKNLHRKLRISEFELLRAILLNRLRHRPECSVQVDACLIELLHDLVRALCNGKLICPAMHLWILGGLIRRIDACKTLDLAFASLLVKAFRVPRLHFFQWCIDEPP